MKLRLESLVKEAKLSLIEREGKVTRSEVYLTNLENNEQVQLCMTPEKIRVRTEENFRTFDIIERGEVKLPKGEELTQIDWDGILPGARLLMYPFLTHVAWEQPIEIIKVFKRWREEGARIRLLITQTPINIDVYIKKFDYEASGGQGNYKYSIELLAAKELKIMTVAEADAARAQAQQDSQNELNQRAANKSKTGYYITQINNAWAAAQLLLGNGGDWRTVADSYGLNDPTKFEPQEVIWM